MTKRVNAATWVTQREILERDPPVPAADQSYRSDEHQQRRQHGMILLCIRPQNQLPELVIKVLAKHSFPLPPILPHAIDDGELL